MRIYFNYNMLHLIKFYDWISLYLCSLLFLVLIYLGFIILFYYNENIKQKKLNIKEQVYTVKDYVWIKFSHQSRLEIIWTLTPMIWLLCIIIPSFKLLYNLDILNDSLYTIKIIAHQWYWSYQYNDIVLNSNMVSNDFLKLGELRLLHTDLPLVIPKNENIRLLITSDDVIHSFTILGLAIKCDAIPGRLAEISLRVFRSGMYYGQCSELCGEQHAFMPIEVLVLPTVNQFYTYLYWLYVDNKKIVL